MSHKASCACGQLTLKTTSNIVRSSICHCFECQKRTGSAFGIQSRINKETARIEGRSSVFTRSGDEPGIAEFHFCPNCGTTLFWYLDGLPNDIIVALGCFTDPTLPSPSVMVYSERKHHWLTMPGSAVEYFD